jgi:hypothetical protein
MASFQEMRGGPHQADCQHRKPDPPPRKALRRDDPAATLASAVRTAWSAVALVSMWVLASASLPRRIRERLSERFAIRCCTCREWRTA